MGGQTGDGGRKRRQKIIEGGEKEQEEEGLDAVYENVKNTPPKVGGMIISPLAVAYYYSGWPSCLPCLPSSASASVPAHPTSCSKSRHVNRIQQACIFGLASEISPLS